MIMNKPIIDNSLSAKLSYQNTSCNWLGTAEFGRLIPFHIEELIPKEKVVTCRPRIEMQMLPLASPTFGKLDLYVHYFAVPIRLLWDAADDAFSRQGSLKNNTPPAFRVSDLTRLYNSDGDAGRQRTFFRHWTALGLSNFFINNATYGPNGDSPVRLDAKSLLPFRAYQQVWWDFYRDPEVLRDDVRSNFLTTSSGVVSYSNMIDDTKADARQFIPRFRSLKDSWIANLFADEGLTPVDLPTGLYTNDTGDQTLPVFTGEPDGLGDSVSVNSAKYLRTVEALTRLSERLSLAGKRQIDAMFAAYGVKPDFMKLKMSQYLGGAKSTVLVSDITSSADTSVLGTNQGAPLGAKAGAGYCAFDNLNIEFEAHEPCYLIGMFSVMPHIHFVQGFNKMWDRNKIEDFFTKSLERTGQVAVSRCEVGIRYPGSSVVASEDKQTFAFTRPYYEYCKGHDILSGDFYWYHNNYGSDPDGNVLPELQYMHSMEMYADFPYGRRFNADNLSLLRLGPQFNKIFFYQGGDIFTDSDDHFMLCIDKQVIKHSPADGYPVGTLETTKEPHQVATSIGTDKVL